MLPGTGVPVIANEIHAPLALSGDRVTPALSLPESAPVAFAVTSASKAWNLAGLKCTFILTGSGATRGPGPGAAVAAGHTLALRAPRAAARTGSPAFAKP